MADRYLKVTLRLPPEAINKIIQVYPDRPVTSAAREILLSNIENASNKFQRESLRLQYITLYKLLGAPIEAAEEKADEKLIQFFGG